MFNDDDSLTYSYNVCSSAKNVHSYAKIYSLRTKQPSDGKNNLEPHRIHWTALDDEIYIFTLREAQSEAWGLDYIRRASTAHGYDERSHYVFAIFLKSLDTARKPR